MGNVKYDMVSITWTHALKVTRISGEIANSRHCAK